ncbi:unnamed protein product, partial [Mesorhabditis belari]|uniref:EF-hand domain-containing protein n=1 Tax=Mesorhabditis belari TaxID=2138241 RepID=A0AAF3EVQ1_9BILA
MPNVSLSARMSLSARTTKNPMIRHKSTDKSGGGKSGGMIEAIKMVAELQLTTPNSIKRGNSFKKLLKMNSRSNFSDKQLKLHSDRDHHSNAAPHSPLLNSKLEGYTEEELAEYRQVFNMFDTDRSGAIGLDELEAAMRNLGLEQTREELDRIIDEVDQRGNHEIDFDEFCDVMRRLYNRKNNWNSVVKECFAVFDRSESGVISKKDFQYILRELGDITDSIIVDEIFMEADVDGNGLLDSDEFTYMCKNYMTDEDIN